MSKKLRELRAGIVRDLEGLVKEHGGRLEMPEGRLVTCKLHSELSDVVENLCINAIGLDEGGLVIYAEIFDLIDGCAESLEGEYKADDLDTDTLDELWEAMKEECTHEV